MIFPELQPEVFRLIMSHIYSGVTDLYTMSGSLQAMSNGQTRSINQVNVRFSELKIWPETCSTL